MREVKNKQKLNDFAKRLKEVGFDVEVEFKENEGYECFNCAVYRTIDDALIVLNDGVYYHNVNKMFTDTLNKIRRHLESFNGMHNIHYLISLGCYVEILKEFASK